MIAWAARPLKAMVGQWSGFWFNPQSAAVLTAIRVGLGITALFWALALLVDLDAFFWRGRLLPTTPYADWDIGLLQWWDTSLAVYVVYLAVVAGAIALIAGVLPRLAAPVLWYGLISMQQHAPAILNAGDQLLRVWAAYFALFALLTPQRFLTVPLLGRRDGDGRRSWPMAPVWVIRLIQIQMTIIYLDSVIAKVPGDTWREGTASYFALGLEDYERFPVPGILRESLLLNNVFTWLTLGLELALPFLLWNKRTRRFAIVAGLGMHVAFDYTMRLGFFLWGMTLGYIAFLLPAEAERILRWMGRRVDALRARSARPGGAQNEKEPGSYVDATNNPGEASSSASALGPNPRSVPLTPTEHRGH